MATWIALLRGINVGGRNTLPMADLRRVLDESGLERVRTYIQSGNVVFGSRERSARRLEDGIGMAIEAECGFRPDVFVMSAKQLQDAATANPFPEAEATPSTLHLHLLATAVTRPDRAALDALAGPREAWAIRGRTFYLHAPDGVARSKLAARAETILGVPATARNWRTVQKLLELASE